MRDPKVHSKVLARRWNAVCNAQLLATRDGDPERLHRLDRLRARIHQVHQAHYRATLWNYFPWGPQTYWRHQGEVIPDTKEDA